MKLLMETTHDRQLTKNTHDRPLILNYSSILGALEISISSVFLEVFNSNDGSIIMGRGQSSMRAPYQERGAGCTE
jgi:hypothetical protein